jgi:beta-galactosidase
MNKKFNPPYLGVAYYPEDWDENEIDLDIQKMLDAGINVARIGEFAWRKMEPKPGQFEFGWLHNVVDKLGAAGIGVVMGTPTATPPIWLSRMYPDVTMEKENGRKAQHGGRRHCCSNNPNYGEYSARMVEALAKEFSTDENIMGWQIDNEIYTGDMGCFCEHCRKKFITHLAEKYGDIDGVNSAWNLNLFSQAYDSFEDIPAPRDAWHNPHLKMEWKICQNNSHIDFVHMQAAVLRKYTNVPIGTDTMPFNGMDYRKLNEPLDVIQFNHYNTAENLRNCGLWFDYLRTLKQRAFWNTETATCWNGSTEINQNIKPEGFCRANSWMPIALGGEANMYWLWRTHWAGHELMHGSVLDTSGKPMHIMNEVQEVAQGYRKAAEFINETKVKTQVAMHFTSLNWNMFETQSVVSGFKYMDTLNDAFYKPLVDSGLRPDVIDAKQELLNYKLIFSPLMMTMEEGGLPERIAQWVKDGGVWVVGPLTDIRNSSGAKYKDRHFGMLEELTGAEWLYGIPDSQGIIETKWQDGSTFTGNRWFDLFEDKDAPVSVVKGHSAIVEKAAVIKRKVGKGLVILLGTIPSYADMMRLISDACREAHIYVGLSEGSLMVVPRAGETEEGLILLEHAGQNAKYTLDRSMVDVLTGDELSGTISIAPYEVKMLKFSN